MTFQGLRYLILQSQPISSFPLVLEFIGLPFSLKNHLLYLAQAPAFGFPCGEVVYKRAKDLLHFSLVWNTPIIDWKELHNIQMAPENNAYHVPWKIRIKLSSNKMTSGSLKKETHKNSLFETINRSPFVLSNVVEFISSQGLL